MIQSVTFGVVPRRGVHPEAGAGLISAVVAGHGITNAVPNTRGMRIVISLVDATGEPRNYQREMSKTLKIYNLPPVVTREHHFLRCWYEHTSLNGK